MTLRVFHLSLFLSFFLSCSEARLGRKDQMVAFPVFETEEILDTEMEEDIEEEILCDDSSESISIIEKIYENNLSPKDKESTVAIKFDGISSQIVGGVEVEKSRYPYMVSVENSKGKHKCGGTLITPNVVLCAAHCWDHAHQVKIGKHHMDDSDDKDVETIKISRRRRSRRYERRTFEYDVMIIKLMEPSTYPTMKLMLYPDNLDNGDLLTVIGYGKVEYQGDKADELREVNVDFLDNDQCNEKYYDGDVTDTMMCAYGNGKDACQGDSGGPLMVTGKEDSEDRQCGVVSWGIDCGVYAGVYANLLHEKVTKLIHYCACHSKKGFSKGNSDYCDENGKLIV